jgi:hypothetical protein
MYKLLETVAEMTAAHAMVSVDVVNLHVVLFMLLFY